MDTDDERMRALLARTDEPGPPLGFTAATIARRGRRIRLLRWGAGVGGVVVVAAGVTVSLLLVTNRPVQPASPPPVANTVTTTTTTTLAPLTTTTSRHFGPTTDFTTTP
ncbi:hypothetical protein [Kutzneria sp. CA-103260]|uniref:hypothetical protein n=1 Tax=Kutzneria sp. CA-103260 TaxID=2802641 RepID=UPI001BA92991|nr:hypothetical protein [Kutzneria sp. CA-103260]QUQ62400.1 hypothetical protein JJ691_01120 [Kutzneria sp. CA-103260]